MKMLEINLYGTHQLIRKKYKIKTKLDFYKIIYLGTGIAKTSEL